jgi:predicted permease
MHAVSRDFVKTFGMRVIEGRGFTADDSARREALINRTLARSGFLGERPIGKRIYSFGNTSWEVVGIVEDVRQWGLDRKADMDMYVVDFVPPPPGLGGIYFAVRTAGEPTAPARSIRDLVRQLEPEATVDNVATMEQLVSNSISRPRLYAVLLGIFAGIAVALAAIGLYGVMAYSVAQRTREIGVRMALGAQRAEVMGLVLRQSVPLIAVGIVLGLIGAAGFTRYLEGMLFGLKALDPSTFIAVSLVFAIVAMFAALVPARRATKVDPIVALRCE